jgi:hypothetical protein
MIGPFLPASRRDSDATTGINGTQHGEGRQRKKISAKENVNLPMIMRHTKRLSIS